MSFFFPERTKLSWRKADIMEEIHYICKTSSWNANLQSGIVRIWLHLYTPVVQLLDCLFFVCLRTSAFESLSLGTPNTQWSCSVSLFSWNEWGKCSPPHILWSEFFKELSSEFLFTKWFDLKQTKSFCFWQSHNYQNKWLKYNS